MISMLGTSGETAQSRVLHVQALTDIRFFPAGIAHSIQALDEGTEFLLVSLPRVVSDCDAKIA